MPSTHPSLVNHQVRLAARPVGLPKPADLQFTGASVAEPANDGVGVQVQALSLGPAMRSWMNKGQRCIPPLGIGEVMRAGGVGTVIASRHPGFVVLVTRARMQGIVESDDTARFPQAIAEMAGCLKDGRMKNKEDVVEGGAAAFPATLNKLFSGENFGKLVLKLA